MKNWSGTVLGVVLVIAACSTGAQSTHDGDARVTESLAEARSEIAPLFERMQATANAHDVDGHLAAYVRDSTLIFVINDQVINGFDALHDQQTTWWRGGKSDVVYRVEGEPIYRLLAPGVVVQTYLLSSHRTNDDGSTREARVVVSAIWQKRTDGWRIGYAHESTGPR
jgi:ketosteroid isomerase-like protein